MLSPCSPTTICMFPFVYSLTMQSSIFASLFHNGGSIPFIAIFSSQVQAWLMVSTLSPAAPFSPCFQSFTTGWLQNSCYISHLPLATYLFFFQFLTISRLSSFCTATLHAPFSSTLLTNAPVHFNFFPSSQTQFHFHNKPDAHSHSASSILAQNLRFVSWQLFLLPCHLLTDLRMLRTPFSTCELSCACQW